MPACPDPASQYQGSLMHRAFDCNPNPLRSAAPLDAWADRARHNLIGRLDLALAVFVTGISLSAQTPNSLPFAPQPHSMPVLLFAQTAAYAQTALYHLTL